MQRYSRDRDRDDEGGRNERGSQSRGEDRYAQGQGRDQRGEFGGRRDQDYERGSGYEGSPYGSNPGSNRWRESGARDRFEEQYGRGGQDDYSTGGSLYGRRDDESRADWNEYGGRSAWQPGAPSQGHARRPQFGETEYGMYGPRYGSSYGAAQGYGDERGDDRFGRQGYGRYGGPQYGGSQYGSSQSDPERGQHHRFDPDYQQWREEQIRNLDNDYHSYRQERYRKFSDEFGTWRKNRESAGGASGTSQDTSSKDLSGSSRDTLGTSKGNK